jgi:putative membrane protein
VLRTLARDYGFRLSLEGDRFRREHGLFTRVEAVIARRRVQLAQVRGGPLRGLFGWSGLFFQTLGAGTDRSGLQGAAPFASRAEIETVLAEAAPLRLPPPPDLIMVSKRHILRSSTAKLVPALAAILAFSVWARPALLLLALLPLLVVAAALERRFHRYALADDLLFVARGVWRRRLWLVPLANVQSLSLSRGPVQRRLGLATLAVDTAGAPLLDAPRIVDLRAEDAEALAAEIARVRSVLRYAGSTGSPATQHERDDIRSS